MASTEEVSSVVNEGGLMSNIKSKMSLSSVTDNLNQLKPFGVYILIAVVLSGIAYFVYIQYWDQLKSKFKHPNAEFNNNPEEIVEILFFGTTWCPHCKDATGPWNNIKERFDGKIFENDKKIIFKKYDCDKDENICDEYKIEGYPTIKISTKDEIVEFEGKPTVLALEGFIKNVIGTDKFKKNKE